MLYVGSLDDPRKQVRSLVEAFAAWKRAEGRGRAWCSPAAARRPRSPVWKASGFVPDEDLPALYSGAECLVTASRYEGFGLPALEALACGTPVVAYDAGAIPEVAGPGALLAPAGDAAALMAAVGRVCDEPELRAELSDAGRRHAAGFSWRAAAEATWDVLRVRGYPPAPVRIGIPIISTNEARAAAPFASGRPRAGQCGRGGARQRLDGRHARAWPTSSACAA